MKRVREKFDFGWKFLKDDVSEAKETVFDDTSWRSLDLPHDWSIEGPFDENDPSGQSLAYLKGGVGFYRKSFTLNEEDRNKRIFLAFDGVYRFSDVWINGHHLGFFPDGYVSFEYELTDYLVFDNVNVVAVRVDNSEQPNSRWYTGSGIYRHTYIIKTAPAYIMTDSTTIQTPTVSAEESSVFILTHLASTFGSAKPFMIDVEILDDNQNVVAANFDARVVPAGGSERFGITLWMKGAHLWDTLDPYLYTARLNVYDGEETDAQKLIDSLDIPFGIRSVEFNKDTGFLLNGKRVKIHGVALHHEAGLLGAAVPDKVWERRLKKLRQMGANGIRTAHSAASPEFMEMCDKLGFLVMDEVYDEWKLSWEKNYSKTRNGVGKALDCRFGSAQYFDEWGEKNMAAVIRRDRNHPSVILWSIGNEIFEQGENSGYLIARRLVEVCHVEDPTRPAMSACELIRSELPGRAARDEFLSALDVIGYNYSSRWGTTFRRFYAEDKLSHPEWKMIGAENQNVFSIRGEYNPDGSNDPLYKKRPSYYMSMLEVEELWKFTNLYDYVAGDYIWTGIDYLGESCWPAISSPAGMLDTCGFEKDSYYFWKSQWSNEPTLKLLPHWNWPGKEGVAIPVICYTNCEEVELFVGGQSYGVQAYDYFRLGQTRNYGIHHTPVRRVTTNNLHLLWMIPYQAGEIKAVGKKDGKIYEEIIRTCGDAAKIELTPDCEQLRADGSDICHVELKLLDKDGNFACRANDNLTFSVEGEGVLLCLDSGNNKSHEIGMYAKNIHAYNGLSIAYIKAGFEKGNIRLTVSGEGIPAQSVSVTVG